MIRKILPLMTLLLVGCSDVRFEHSEKKTTPGKVIVHHHQPDRWEWAYVPTMNFDGEIEMKWQQHHVPAKWKVVIETDEATFTLRSPRYYNLVQLHQIVDVVYTEVWKAVYDNDTIQSREFWKYKFVDLK